MTEYTYKKWSGSADSVFADGEHIGYVFKTGAEFGIPVEIRRKWVATTLLWDDCKDKNGWIIFHNTRREAAATLSKEVTA